ncbi:hypothetical protein DVA76_18055 [Acinetobacter baumannii]|nr:hypothetical protein DVA76_18055 [Acinetobacter baumannii]
MPPPAEGYGCPKLFLLQPGSVAQRKQLTCLSSKRQGDTSPSEMRHHAMEEEKAALDGELTLKDLTVAVWFW